MKKIIIILMTLLLMGVLAAPVLATDTTPLPSSQTLGQMIEKSGENEFWANYVGRIQNGVFLGVIPTPLVLAILLALIVSIALVSNADNIWRKMTLSISSGLGTYLIALLVEPIALVAVMCGIVWLIVFGVYCFIHRNQ
jgi:hypothetical protein